MKKSLQLLHASESDLRGDQGQQGWGTVVGTVTADLKLLLLTPPSYSRDWITVRARERGRDEPGLRQRGKVFVMSLFSTLMHGALPFLEQETAGGPPHPSPLQQCGAALSIMGQVRAS